MLPAKTFQSPAFWVMAALTVTFVALSLLLWFDPSQHAIFPVCPLHRMTGLNCPGCGGLRAVHHLLHGRWLTAFHHNPLVVLAAPLGLVVCLGTLARGQSFMAGFRSFSHPTFLFMGAAVIVAFGILRNLPYPAFAWMSP